MQQPSSPRENPTASQPRDDKPVSVTHTQIYSAPLPPPAILEHYDRIVPGAADRIIAMAEAQSLHRRQLEVSHLRYEFRLSTMGLIFALLIGLAGLGTAVALAWIGHPYFGGAFGFIALATLVGSFIYGSQRRSDPPSRNE